MAGNGTNCIRIVPYSAVQFSAYNVYKRVSSIYFFSTATAVCNWWVPAYWNCLLRGRKERIEWNMQVEKNRELEPRKKKKKGRKQSIAEREAENRKLGDSSRFHLLTTTVL